MTWRARIAAFGSTALLVIAGAVCAAVFGGGTGQFVGFSLIGVGLVIATGLVFLEVGLSEDRERAREREAALGKPPKGPGRLKAPHLERSRGHRRRLE
jgi:hypothetical protein